VKISELKPNELNPRKISEQNKKELKKSVDKFGDLSGIIYNRQTKRLVGGHQRTDLFPASATITKKDLNEPTRTGTVAEGYITSDGERFKYREVDWTKEIETAAMIAANKHGGEWDKEILKLNFANLKNIDLELTGFDAKELKELNIDFTIPEIKIETDEQTVKNTPKTTEQIPTMNPNENVKKDFNEVKENAEIVNKRFVIIIDCPDQDIKDSLREKLQPEIVQAGCKIF